MSNGQIATALMMLAGAALLALPLWPEDPESANRRLEERVDRLEKQLDKVSERSRGNEAKLVATDVVIDEVSRKVGRLEPANATWIELRAGGGNKWVLANGDEASVKFMEMKDNLVVLKISHRTLDSQFALRVGESVRAVDDRGTELRVYTTTLHGVERDRTGQPRRARVSVAYAVESGL